MKKQIPTSKVCHIINSDGGHFQVLPSSSPEVPHKQLSPHAFLCLLWITDLPQNDGGVWQHPQAHPAALKLPNATISDQALQHETAWKEQGLAKPPKHPAKIMPGSSISKALRYLGGSMKPQCVYRTESAMHKQSQVFKSAFSRLSSLHHSSPVMSHKQEAQATLSELPALPSAPLEKQAPGR